MIQILTLFLLHASLDEKDVLHFIAFGIFRWILKCHACYTVTPEIGKEFCPKCGNGGTLRKVAVTIGENGAVISARNPRISTRGVQVSSRSKKKTTLFCCQTEHL